MNKLLSTLLLTPIAFSVFAEAPNSQTNCDLCPQKECPPSDCPAEEEKGPWTNNLNFGFNKTDGNSDTSLLTGSISSTYDNGDDKIVRLGAEHNFGENDNETNIDYSKGHAEYKNLHSEKFYTGIGSNYIRDEIADVKYRVTINPSVGYFIFKNDKGFLDVEAGPSYVFEEVSNQADDYLAPRLAERFEYQISETSKFFQSSEILLSAEDSENYIIQAEAGIESTIIGDFKLGLKIRDSYDNQPGIEKERNDIAFLTTVGLDF